MSDDDREELRSVEADRTMIGRIVEPIEFGRFAVALMRTPIVTGAIIPVDGGVIYQSRVRRHAATKAGLLVANKNGSCVCEP